MAETVKIKSKCCKSGPRCRRCPVVYRRLEKEGLAERVSKRRYVLLELPAKKQMKLARRR